MLDSWILEDLDISFIYEILKNKINTDQNIIQKAGAYSRYNDVHKQYTDVPYSKHGAYAKYPHAEYGDYSGYDKIYNDAVIHGKQGYLCAYSDHSNYSKCAYQCQVNQYLSQYIGEPTFAVNDIFIYASLLNNFISYINKGIDKINDLVTSNNLDNSYKISPKLSEVAVADVYYASTFNNINNTIKKFINGATNIANKTQNTDEIKITELQSFKEILKYLQIPPTVPRA